MLRRKDYFHIILIDIRIQLNAEYIFIILFIHILTNHGNQLFLFSGRLCHDGKLILNCIYSVDNLLCQCRHQLTSFFIIQLISVVFLRIMRSGNHDTSKAVKMTNSEAQLRCRAKTFKHIGCNVVGRKHLSGIHSEFL